MVQKKQSKTIQPTKKNSLSNIPDIDIEGLSRDINALIEKYSVGNMSNMLLTTDVISDKDKGFYLTFIKRDDKAPLNQRLQITAFGQYIGGLDLGMCFYDILQQLEPKNDTNNYA